MKAIILSAGQGKRLLPLTETTPKCLLSVDADKPALEIQLHALAECGIEHATIIVGFGAEKVESFLATCPVHGIDITTRYNPFFAVSNNLATCWTAIPEMHEDFLLVNGDTVFEPAVLQRLLIAPSAPIVLAIDRKAEYDEDDMKVSVRDGQSLTAVGKRLPPSQVNGESIGIMRFRAGGAEAFCAALETAMREPASLQRWYLSIIDTLADSSRVEVVSIEGVWWAEIDTPEDLAEVRAHFAAQQATLSSYEAVPPDEAVSPIGEP